MILFHSFNNLFNSVNQGKPNSTPHRSYYHDQHLFTFSFATRYTRERMVDDDDVDDARCGVFSVMSSGLAMLLLLLRLFNIKSWPEEKKHQQQVKKKKQHCVFVSPLLQRILFVVYSTICLMPSAAAAAVTGGFSIIIEIQFTFRIHLHVRWHRWEDSLRRSFYSRWKGAKSFFRPPSSATICFCRSVPRFRFWYSPSPVFPSSPPALCRKYFKLNLHFWEPKMMRIHTCHRVTPKSPRASNTHMDIGDWKNARTSCRPRNCLMGYDDPFPVAGGRAAVRQFGSVAPTWSRTIK